MMSSILLYGTMTVIVTIYSGLHPAANIIVLPVPVELDPFLRVYRHDEEALYEIVSRLCRSAEKTK